MEIEKPRWAKENCKSQICWVHMEEIKWAKCKSKKKWKRSDGPVAIDKAFGPSENVKAQRDRLEMERAVTK